MSYEDHGHFRRRYPRRAFTRSLGFLHQGKFEVVACEEIGEGGLAFVSGAAIPVGEDVVVNFRIPGGDFVSLRANIRSSRDIGGSYLHGVAFTTIEFTHKRQIRTYVSERAEGESVRYN